MILDQLERAFMVIGDKMITVGGGQNKFDDYEATSELVVKPRAEEPRPYIETRLSLNDMTKQAICDLCMERYGIELNFRTEKKQLITEYLAIQDQEI
jgi:hypothetical protein